MNLEQLKQLIDLMKEANLVELELEGEGYKVKIRKGERGGLTGGGTESAEAVSPKKGQEPASPAALTPKVVEFRSPLVGTFYRASKPDAEPFADVGDPVGPDKVLCIVEAMKVMNEIKAEMTGRIREILVKNGQAVEYGEPLFLIEVS
jgi:acetyl-CoA carboxylase biotin carboxyl carrier protein